MSKVLYEFILVVPSSFRVLILHLYIEFLNLLRSYNFEQNISLLFATSLPFFQDLCPCAGILPGQVGAMAGRLCDGLDPVHLHLLPLQAGQGLHRDTRVQVSELALFRLETYVYRILIQRRKPFTISVGLDFLKYVQILIFFKTQICTESVSRFSIHCTYGQW